MTTRRDDRSPFEDERTGRPSLLRPSLHTVAAPPAAEGIVLVLHGGRERGLSRVRPGQLSVLRMVPIARRIAAAGSGRLAVSRLQFAVRGWNGAAASPVADAEWAIDQIRLRYGPDVPLALVGHSMGGRTALRVGGAAGVRSVVGLAPWLPGGEPTGQLRGRRVLLVHGSADRVTSPRASARYVETLGGVTAGASFVEVVGGEHTMLRRREVFESLAAGFVTGTLLDPAPAARPSAGPLPDVVQQVLTGSTRLSV
ncbi:MAG: alpha/beta hydrolase [bacterium]